ncbi:MAG: hypothetical protein WAT19_15225 [Ferruginibacter sp.]
MFAEGQVIYFSPFFFKNGNTSKNKYFIVLKSVESRLIIASLPTRSCKAPSLITVSHGCNNDNERMFNCYAFQENIIITDAGFYFELPTYIYGNEVEDYQVSLLDEVYKIEGIDYELKGILLKQEYDALLICLKQSRAVKRGIKRML